MSALITAAVAVTAASVYSIYSGERQAGMQRDAQNQALANAKKQEQAANEANNRANQKKPDTASILAAAQQSAGGAGSTMLTGPAGVSLGAASLGKNTLLGG